MAPCLPFALILVLPRLSFLPFPGHNLHTPASVPSCLRLVDTRHPRPTPLTLRSGNTDRAPPTVGMVLACHHTPTSSLRGNKHDEEQDEESSAPEQGACTPRPPHRPLIYLPIAARCTCVTYCAGAGNVSAAWWGGEFKARTFLFSFWLHLLIVPIAPHRPHPLTTPRFAAAPRHRLDPVHTSRD
ncbi:hypothetical protein C8F04DRAFT_1264259 [Mycena alexandri]|uniref:Secreted protein n=1 Tax=Mycena alexandri TaxID=1745969 RepID=A0AAD6SLM9_9AGAR|nr:hypothetical protein C8F04DRAFT_1264259 [Mycena alexandri]